MSRRPCTPAVLLLLLATFGCGGGGGSGFGGGPPVTPAATAGVQAFAAVLVATTADPVPFLGQASDVEGGAVAYAWDFDEDGSIDSTEPSPSFTFASEGAHTVRLTATDADGGATQAEVVVGILDAPTPTAPAVALRLWTLHASAPVQVFARAYAVDPDGGTIRDYAFDFDGDGVADVSGAAPTASFLLPLAGTIQAAVRVTDDEAQTSTARATLVLCEGAAYPDQAPSCQIEVPSGAATTDTSSPLELVACGADLDGGSIAAIDWDLDDDGVFGDLSGRVIAAAFASEGVRRVRVRLTDEEGAVSEACLHVLVSDAPPASGRPSVWASAEALVVAPAQAIRFHAQAAGGDAPLLFSWDFDGDGSEDASTPEASFAFVTPGAYRPRCSVTDVDGDTSTSDLTVLVEGCGASAAPFWRYQATTLGLLPGGTATITLAPALTSTATPSDYRLLAVRGPAADPQGLELLVRDHTLQALPPATAPVAVPMDGLVPIEIESLTLGGGGAPVQVYDADVRLERPGVRVQVIPVEVHVLDLAWTSFFAVANNPVFADQYSASLQVGLASAAGALPAVHQVELVLGDMTPAWQELILRSSVFLPFGWSQAADATSLIFTTPASPVSPGGIGPIFQFGFDTDSAGAGVGPPHADGRVILRDAAGRRVGRVGLLLP